jgi:uncharacterized repeat protein (TIGR03803 family)
MKRFEKSRGVMSLGKRVTEFSRRKKVTTGQKLIESLEQRQLLAFSPDASFSNNTTGAAPSGSILADDSGDIFAAASTGGTPAGAASGTGNGTLVELAKGSTSLNVLATFNGTNGSGPIDSMVLDSSGDIFGVTEAGGANNLGTLFEWQTTGTLKDIVSFDGTTGDEPQGGLIVDGVGNLYGTTTSGGASNDGTVYELPRGSTTVDVLASFNGTNGHSSIGRLLLDSTGNLFGTTEQGGTNDVGVIFEVPAGSGTILALHSFNAANTSDGSEPLGGLIADNAGNLYGTTASGGTTTAQGGDGTVFEFTPGSGAFTSLASFNGANGQTPIGSLYMDGAGNLFGTANLGGGGDGDIFAVVKGSGAITEVQSFGGFNGANPGFGLTLDSNGNLDGITSSGGADGGGTIFSIALNPAAATQLEFVQQPSNSQLGVSLLPSLWVAVEDANGNIVQSDNSTVTLSMGTEGSIGGTATAVVKNGIAVFSGITVSPNTLGPYTIKATDGSLTGATSHAFSLAAQGFVDSANMNEITGWSYDPTNNQATEAVKIEVEITGGPTQTFLANEDRPDLTSIIGSADHGFTYATPMLSAGSHTASIYELTNQGAKLLIGISTLVSQNSLFDEHYYLETNPDVAAAVAKGTIATGYDHYIQFGQFEGRSPSPYWNESWYLQQNPDVAAAVKAKTVSSGFMHYYLYGQYENRPGLLYFNASYYLATYIDVAAAVKAGTLTSAFEHYVLYGQYEGRSPMLYFNSALYDALNPDILPDVTGETFTSNFEHFIEYGQYEGRVASSYYNEATYLLDNPDVAAAVKKGTFADGFQHWLEYGQFEGRKA